MVLEHCRKNTEHTFGGILVAWCTLLWFAMDCGESGEAGKQRHRAKISWKFLTVLLVCISNSILTVVLWTLLIPLREEINTLKTRDLQDGGGIGVKNAAVGVHGVSRDGHGVVLEFDGVEGSPVEGDSDEEVEEQFGEHSRERRSRRRHKSGKKSTEKRPRCKDCKCEKKHKKKTQCRKCCNRKVRRHASEQLKNMQNNITALNDKIQKILANDSIEESLFGKANDKLFKSRLGHFEGSSTLKEGCDNKIDGVDPDRVFTAKDGSVCLWEYANWMSPGAKKLYQLDDLGRVKVTESGMYFIYGQLIQDDMDSYASAGIFVGSRPRAVAQCTETAGITSATNKKTATIRTCYMGVLTRVEKRELVFIKMITLHGNRRKIWHNSNTGYFGLIRFS